MRKLVVLVGFLAVLGCGCGSEMVGPPPEDDPEAVFEAFWGAYDRYYAHFELKEIDWDAVYAEYRPQVGPETTDEELFDILAAMIGELQDGHVYLVGDGRRAISNRDLRRGGTDFDAATIQRQYLSDVDTGSDGGRFVYGRIGESIGYLRIATLSGGTGVGDEVTGWIEEVDRALDELADTRALIVDLRNNPGGRAYNARYVAQRFATDRRRFLITRSRNGPDHDDFSAPNHWYVEPRGETIDQPVVVVTNRNTFSAAEWLTLGLRQFDHVTHIGTHTGGGLAMFLPRQLPNGWMHTVSVQDTRGPGGRSYERVGIPPHWFVAPDRESPEDALLEQAIEYVGGGE